MACRDSKYFKNLWQLEEDDISNCDLEIYIKHFEKLQEDFKVHFRTLMKMLVPNWIDTLFYLEIENADIESYLEDGLVDMYVDLEAKSLFRSKNLSDDWNNILLLNTQAYCSS